MKNRKGVKQTEKRGAKSNHHRSHTSACVRLAPKPIRRRILHLKVAVNALARVGRVAARRVQPVDLLPREAGLVEGGELQPGTAAILGAIDAVVRELLNGGGARARRRRLDRRLLLARHDAPRVVGRVEVEEGRRRVGEVVVPREQDRVRLERRRRCRNVVLQRYRRRVVEQ